MNEATPALTTLLGTPDGNEFFERHWEKEPLHIRRNDPEWYYDVLRSADVEQFLTRGDLRYPALRMAKDGPTILPSAYSSVLKFGPYASEGLIDVEKVRELHAGGATVILQMTRGSIPRLGLFADRLHAEIGAMVETTVYLTPANSQGFTTHYDTHSVFVLQISGTKRWRLYDVMWELPTLQQTADKFGRPPGPVRSEIVLQPGDMLYVPRGLGHDALAESEASLHVTVGVFPPTYLDLLNLHVTECRQDVRFRRSPWDLVTAGDVASIERQSAELLKVLRDSFRLERLKVEHVRRDLKRMTQSNGGRLFDQLHLHEVSASTVIARRRDVHCERVQSDGRVTLSFYDKKLSFPESVATAINNIFARPTLPVAELQTNLSEQSKITVARKLITEGLVRIVSLT